MSTSLRINRCRPTGGRAPVAFSLASSMVARERARGGSATCPAPRSRSTRGARARMSALLRFGRRGPSCRRGRSGTQDLVEADHHRRAPEARGARGTRRSPLGQRESHVLRLVERSPRSGPRPDREEAFVARRHHRGAATAPRNPRQSASSRSAEKIRKPRSSLRSGRSGAAQGRLDARAHHLRAPGGPPLPAPDRGRPLSLRLTACSTPSRTT
jgi:hypothetical protein